MRLGAICKWFGCDLAHKIEHNYAKRGLQSITSIKKNQYVIRGEHSGDKYVKTTLDLNENGRVNKARAMFMQNPDKLKEELLLFISR